MKNKTTIIVALISLIVGIIIGSFLPNNRSGGVYASKADRKADEDFIKRLERDEKEWLKSGEKFSRRDFMK